MTRKLLLRGTPASPGKVQGKVKVILDPKECKKMKKGEILVTVMTDPLYLPAIEKAKAIITDIGGLLSHAAIIARELGIPCIVNTKKATKVLKDGVEVIVDGTKGMIYGKK